MRILTKIVQTGLRRFNVSHHPSCVCIAARLNHSQNYYDVLEVSPRATDKEIREAFIKMSKELHPDTSKGDEESFNRLTEAYNVLSKPLSREQYNRKLYVSVHSVEFAPQNRQSFYQEQKKKHSPFILKNFIEYTITCTIIVAIIYSTLHLAFYLHPHVQTLREFDPKEARKKKAMLEKEYKALQQENRMIKEKEEMEKKQMMATQ